VQHRHGALELSLHFGIARSRESNFAEFLFRRQRRQRYNEKTIEAKNTVLLFIRTSFSTLTFIIELRDAAKRFRLHVLEHLAHLLDRESPNKFHFDVA
jgi:hypothetical protein